MITLNNVEGQYGLKNLKVFFHYALTLILSFVFLAVITKCSAQIKILERYQKVSEI